MVKHFEEIHEKVKDVEAIRVTTTSGTSTGEIIRKVLIISGTVSSDVSDIVIGSGTATMDGAAYVKPATGTAVPMDGYIVVNIGGTTGIIPVYEAIVG